jgi:hypothetical protein
MKNFTLKVLVLACSLFFIGNVNGQDVIDLSGIDNPAILNDTLPDIASGSVVLLGPGKVYNAGYAFDKSVTFKSSDPSSEEMPRIDCSINFNVLDAGSVDSVVFNNIVFANGSDGFGNRYVFNIDKSGTIGEIKFESCEIRSLRGITRMKAGTGSLNKFTITDCVIDSIKDYGLLTVDINTWICNNILIQNSTISKAIMLFTSRNNTNTFLIDGCTINESPEKGRQMFRWREGGQDNILEGITLKNTIWGHGWNTSGDYSDVLLDGFDGLGSTIWTIENTYATSEFGFAEGKDVILGFPNVTYNGGANDLWNYPYEGDFTFLDESFAGIGKAGDPRWAPETPAEGMEWNMSADAFKALGDMVTTSTVEGLTIYATDGKNVTVDESAKTVGDMSFTHRIKFNGSGSFDEAGLPTGRVLAFDVTGNTKITIIATSASSSADRKLNIAAGNNTNVLTEIPALMGTVSSNEYDYVGEATKILLYSPNSGVNVYYIKAEPLATAINQISTDSPEVNIYPNPATDKVYVDYNKPIQVAVYNIAGSLLKSKMIQSKSDYISISDLQPGMYLIRSQNNNTFSKKLIKR